jgi:hypothetical protein
MNSVLFGVSHAITQLFVSDYWRHHVTEKREWFLEDEKYKATT